MESDRSQFLITERRCSVCMSPIRAEVDAMLLGEARTAADVQFTYDEIVAWADGQGVQLTPSSLSRHRHNHLQPSVMMALDTQRYMDAMAKVTGKQLSVHSAVANVVATKALRMLDDMNTDEIDPEKLLRVAMRAAEVALKIELAQPRLAPEIAQKIDEKITAAVRGKNIDPDTLATIRQELYGLAS